MKAVINLLMLRCDSVPLTAYVIERFEEGTWMTGASV